MAKEKLITQAEFDGLLVWLDHNREFAAQKYEKIRHRLIQIFMGRGCFDAEELADETINRVTVKLPQLIGNYSGDPTLYFYGVANNIHHEWLRRQKNLKEISYSKQDELRLDGTRDKNEIEYECLETCLKSLSHTEKQLVTDYYREEKSAKIEYRRQMAERLEITTNALQIKMSRIRAILKKCLQRCLDGKEA